MTFFSDEDYAAYLELISEWCDPEGVAIWAYWLMPICSPICGRSVSMEKDSASRPSGSLPDSPAPTT